ncbi:MAG: tetratricopeptide repeat protein [Chryseobacterium jejuense]|uniref:tetratricopeptide repeat protein n=1 Tax=Chryseobacterium jejuense TaxID=445960 RepID=UPI003D0FDCB1
MNKILFILSFFVTGFWASAQTFTDKALQQSASQLNTTNTEGDYDKLFKKFTETNTSEKWQAFYYAAVSMYLKAELLSKKSTASATHSIVTAEKFALGGSLSQPDSAENNILLGLITLQSIQLNVYNDPAKAIEAVSKYISKAESSDPNNPRLAILKAKSAEKSGNVTEAEAQYQKAATGFTTLSAVPGWGKQLIPGNK